MCKIDKRAHENAVWACVSEVAGSRKRCIVDSGHSLGTGAALLGSNNMFYI